MKNLLSLLHEIISYAQEQSLSNSNDISFYDILHASSILVQKHHDALFNLEYEECTLYPILLKLSLLPILNWNDKLDHYIAHEKIKLNDEDQFQLWTHNVDEKSLGIQTMTEDKIDDLRTASVLPYESRVERLGSKGFFDDAITAIEGWAPPHLHTPLHLSDLSTGSSSSTESRLRRSMDRKDAIVSPTTLSSVFTHWSLYTLRKQYERKQSNLSTKKKRNVKSILPSFLAWKMYSTQLRNAVAVKRQACDMERLWKSWKAWRVVVVARYEKRALDEYCNGTILAKCMSNWKEYSRDMALSYTVFTIWKEIYRSQKDIATEWYAITLTSSMLRTWREWNEVQRNAKKVLELHKINTIFIRWKTLRTITLWNANRKEQLSLFAKGSCVRQSIQRWHSWKNECKAQRFYKANVYFTTFETCLVFKRAKKQKIRAIVNWRKTLARRRTRRERALVVFRKMQQRDVLQTWRSWQQALKNQLQVTKHGTKWNGVKIQNCFIAWRNYISETRNLKMKSQLFERQQRIFLLQHTMTFWKVCSSRQLEQVRKQQIIEKNRIMELALRHYKHWRKVYALQIQRGLGFRNQNLMKSTFRQWRIKKKYWKRKKQEEIENENYLLRRKLQGFITVWKQWNNECRMHRKNTHLADIYHFQNASHETFTAWRRYAFRKKSSRTLQKKGKLHWRKRALQSYLRKWIRYDTMQLAIEKEHARVDDFLENNRLQRGINQWIERTGSVQQTAKLNLRAEDHCSSSLHQAIVVWSSHVAQNRNVNVLHLEIIEHIQDLKCQKAIQIWNRWTNRQALNMYGQLHYHHKVKVKAFQYWHTYYTHRRFKAECQNTADTFQKFHILQNSMHLWKNLLVEKGHRKQIMTRLMQLTVKNHMYKKWIRWKNYYIVQMQHYHIKQLCIIATRQTVSSAWKAWVRSTRIWSAICRVEAQAERQVKMRIWNSFVQNVAEKRKLKQVLIDIEKKAQECRNQCLHSAIVTSIRSQQLVLQFRHSVMKKKMQLIWKAWNRHVHTRLQKRLKVKTFIKKVGNPKKLIKVVLEWTHLPENKVLKAWTDLVEYRKGKRKSLQTANDHYRQSMLSSSTLVWRQVTVTVHKQIIAARHWKHSYLVLYWNHLKEYVYYQRALAFQKAKTLHYACTSWRTSAMHQRTQKILLHDHLHHCSLRRMSSVMTTWLQDTAERKAKRLQRMTSTLHFNARTLQQSICTWRQFFCTNQINRSNIQLIMKRGQIRCLGVHFKTWQTYAARSQYLKRAVEEFQNQNKKQVLFYTLIRWQKWNRIQQNRWKIAMEKNQYQMQSLFFDNWKKGISLFREEKLKNTLADTFRCTLLLKKMPTVIQKWKIFKFLQQCENSKIQYGLYLWKEHCRCHVEWTFHCRKVVHSIHIKKLSIFFTKWNEWKIWQFTKKEAVLQQQHRHISKALLLWRHSLVQKTMKRLQMKSIRTKDTLAFQRILWENWKVQYKVKLLGHSSIYLRNWTIWQQYVLYRQAKQQRRKEAILMYSKKSKGKSMYTWKHFVEQQRLKNIAYQLALDFRRRRKIVQALSTWRREIQIVENRRNVGVVIQQQHDFLQKKTWYSTWHAFLSLQHRLAMIIHTRNLKFLATSWTHFQQYVKESLQKRIQRTLAVTHGQQKLIFRIWHLWRHVHVKNRLISLRYKKSISQQEKRNSYAFIHLWKEFIFYRKNTTSIKNTIAARKRDLERAGIWSAWIRVWRQHAKVKERRNKVMTVTWKVWKDQTTLPARIERFMKTCEKRRELENQQNLRHILNLWKKASDSMHRLAKIAQQVNKMEIVQFRSVQNKSLVWISWRNLYVAKQLYARTVLVKNWLCWKKIALEKAVLSCKLLMFSKIRKQKVLKEIYDVWQQYSTTSRTIQRSLTLQWQKNQKDRVKEQYKQRQWLYCTFAAWKHENSCQKSLLQSAAAYSAAKIRSSSWQKWKYFSHIQLNNRKALNILSDILSSSRRSTSFTQLQSYTRTRKHTRKVLYIATTFFQHKTLTSGINEWKNTWKRKVRMKKALEFPMKKTLQTWKKEVEECRTIRLFVAIAFTKKVTSCLKKWSFRAKSLKLEKQAQENYKRILTRGLFTAWSQFTIVRIQVKVKVGVKNRIMIHRVWKRWRLEIAHVREYKMVRGFILQRAWKEFQHSIVVQKAYFYKTQIFLERWKKQRQDNNHLDLIRNKIQHADCTKRTRTLWKKWTSLFQESCQVHLARITFEKTSLQKILNEWTIFTQFRKTKRCIRQVPFSLFFEKLIKQKTMAALVQLTQHRKSHRNTVGNKLQIFTEKKHLDLLQKFVKRWKKHVQVQRSRKDQNKLVRRRQLIHAVTAWRNKIFDSAHQKCLEQRAVTFRTRILSAHCFVHWRIGSYASNWKSQRSKSVMVLGDILWCSPLSVNGNLE